VIRESWKDVLEEFEIPPEVPGIDGNTKGEVLQVKVVLFDVYGTLVKPLIGDLDAQLRNKMSVSSFQETLRRFGLPEDLGEVLYKSFYAKVAEVHEELKNIGIGRPEVLIEHIWISILAENGIRVSVEEARSLSIYREMKANPVAAFSGVTECLEKLSNSGVGLGLVSNSQFYTLPILGKVLRIDPGKIFNSAMMFMSYRLGFAKPDPHFFLLARTALAIEGIKPEEAVVVGNDWTNDVEAARKFGFQTIYFCGEGQNNIHERIETGTGCAVAYNYKQVEGLLRLRG